MNSCQILTPITLSSCRPDDAVSSYLRIPSPIYRYSHLYDFRVSYKLFFMSLDEHSSPTLSGSKISIALLFLGTHYSILRGINILVLLALFYVSNERYFPYPFRLKNFDCSTFSRHPLFYPSWDRYTGFVGSFFTFPTNIITIVAITRKSLSSVFL